MNERICVLCAHYHPRADPHYPDRGQTCAAGRRRLESEVLALRAGYRRLLELDAPEPPNEIALRKLRPGEVGRNDATNRYLPAAPVPAPSKQPSVSGSREKRIPLTDIADLTAPAQTGSVSDPHRDQVGYHSVATVLNEWVGAWHERYFSTQRRPAPDPTAMFDWVLGVRLELLCDADEAICDFAAEIAELRGVIRYHLGESEPRRQPMWGVACPRCDMMSQLTLDPEDPDKYRECANCGKLMTQEEYHAHLRSLVDQYRSSHDLAHG